MNGEVRKQLNQRFNLLKIARTTPKHSKEWKAYRKARNRCTSLIRSEKAKYWENKFIQSDSSKSFWSLVKKFKGKSKDSHIGPLKRNEKTITDENEKANIMNNFFATVGKKLSTPPEIDSDGTTNSYIYRITPTIDKIDYSKELLTKSFKSAVKVGKSCGPDQISAKDLHLHTDGSINGLHHVVKQSLNTGTFPAKWKTSKVTPIYKKGVKSDCSNYRPVSLLSIPSKVVEHLVCSQLNSHLQKQNLQTEHQWGFRPQRSTEDMLLYMTEKWRKSIDNNEVVAVLFIDFRKAFDSVSHQILIKKMMASGISGDFLSYLTSYLSDRKQFTSLNGAESSLESVEYGVPQGSLIGPPSFSINVNDMSDCIDSDLDQLADDSTTYTTGLTADAALDSLQISACQLESYAKRNSLTIHPDKCKILVMSRNRFIGPYKNITLCGKSVEIVSSTKCLGITIDEKLEWEEHVRKITKSFSTKLKKLYQMRGMPLPTLSTIYFQGILPSVIYGILIWGNCSDNLMSYVENVHIKAARFINRVKKSVRDNAVLAKVKWKPIIYYYKRSLACKVYKIYNNLGSPLLSDLIVKTKSRKSRNTLKIDMSSFKYVGFKRSFRYRNAIVWNNIPDKIKKMDNFKSFKKDLKKSDCLDKVNFKMTGRALLHEEYIYY